MRISINPKAEPCHEFWDYMKTFQPNMYKCLHDKGSASLSPTKWGLLQSRMIGLRPAPLIVTCTTDSMTIELPEDLDTALRAYATERSMSPKAAVRGLLGVALREHQGVINSVARAIAGDEPVTDKHRSIARAALACAEHLPRKD